MPCRDCRVDTGNAPGVGHYYMVFEEVWTAATRDDARVRWLCLDCLEARLGRPLRAVDFTLTPSELTERMASPEGEHTMLPELERQRWLDYWRAVPRPCNSWRLVLPLVESRRRAFSQSLDEEWQRLPKFVAKLWCVGPEEISHRADVPASRLGEASPTRALPRFRERSPTFHFG
jgi:hypothetical protein